MINDENGAQFVVKKDAAPLFGCIYVQTLKRISDKNSGSESSDELSARLLIDRKRR